MTDSSAHSGPVRVVARVLLLWSLFAAGISTYYVLNGSPAAWAGIGVGAVTLGLAFWSKQRGLWLQPLFAAHYVLALGCIVAGPIANIDLYVVGGIVLLTILSVGLAIIVRLGELAKRAP